MREDSETLMRILSDEGKDKEKVEESEVKLSDNAPKDLTIDYLRTQLDRKKEEIEGLIQDRKQRKVFSYVIFVFMAVYMVASLVIIFLNALSIASLSDSVLITLITTSLANVIGIFNFVAKYLFHTKD